jgi:hypothetical protein
MNRESPTWTGCHFTGDEVAAFAREQHLQLVALSGLQTQYLWVTLRKPPAELPKPDFSQVILKAVTAAGSAEHYVPQRGREAAVSLWIGGMPEAAHLAILAAGFDGVLQPGCYLSPIAENGVCQFDAMLPSRVRPGIVPVTLHFHDGALLAGPVSIEVKPGPPWNPKVRLVTDSINIASKYRIETRGVKVTIDDVERPDEVSFHVEGLAVGWVLVEFKDPVTFNYEFSFYLPEEVRGAECKLDVSVSGRALPSITLQVETGAVPEKRTNGHG